MHSTLLSETAPEIMKVSVWPRHPSVYEINTWIWLSELSRRYGRKVDLSSVPPSEWDAIAAWGWDAVWFMGVWERSPAGIAIANRNPDLLASFRQVLPDFHPEDNVGSPYCVRRYVVDPNIGGTDGLAVARRELSDRGVNVILDFVPNHVAPDHPWVAQRPEYFIRGSADDLRKDASSYVEVEKQVIACGRDPFFPAWPDVLQLNAFDPSLRQAVTETLSTIAGQCDGVRFDMAMLVLNSVFERTWSTRAGQRPETEYWADVISAVKKQYPGFLFIAEAYWDLEWQLQQLGFDYCYDKKLYDRLEHGDPESIRLHLCADLSYQDKLVRFIENHDEPRAAATFYPAQERAVAVLTATIPGMRLFHEGQFEGRRVRLPVFLGRRPEEAANRELQDFYLKLLRTVDQSILHKGEWSLCARTGWPDNHSYRNLVAWNWVQEDERFLVVINLSNAPAQARIQLEWTETRGSKWLLFDTLSNLTYERDGDEMLSPGLYVELGPWGCHLFQCLRAQPGLE